MDAVIELGQGAIEVPGQRQAAVLVHLESLEFLDQVELELNRYPGSELEGDVSVCVGTAITPRLGDQPAGMGCVYPLTWRQDEAVEPCPVFKPLEFEGFETGVIQSLPYAQELDGVAVSHPVLDDMVGSIRFFVLGNVRQGNIVITRLAENRDRSAFDFDGAFHGFAHCGSYGANWFKGT